MKGLKQTRGECLWLTTLFCYAGDSYSHLALSIWATIRSFRSQCFKQSVQEVSSICNQLSPLNHKDKIYQRSSMS
ncbi:hypothetical protein FGO68_gene16627 [Halteria grandinella]|uniref:Uncharacterized protein n=1 Tax=Halteria grandinella TaxID=5974 RepID=A0A8J8P2Y1_HALGN|nr:hypothetical protein FGO68_gene16627 [Halteria grandinella]